MAAIVHPYPIRFNDEDLVMVEFLKGRLAVDSPSQVVRHAVRRLYQAEMRDAAKELKKKPAKAD